MNRTRGVVGDGYARIGLRIRRRVLVIVLSLSAGSIVVVPSPARADRATCGEARCSAPASVRFTIVIPATLSLQSSVANSAPPMTIGTAQNINGLVSNTNTRQPVSYTTGADGRVTVSLP